VLKEHGRQHSFLRIGEEERTRRGRSPLHDTTENRYELGRAMMFSMFEYSARKPPKGKGRKMASWQSDHPILPSRSRKLHEFRGHTPILKDRLMGIHEIVTHNRARNVGQGMLYRRAVCGKNRKHGSVRGIEIHHKVE